MEHIQEKTTKMAKYFCGSVVGRFIITFLILHSIHFVSSIVYVDWCMDMSILGFFRSMVNGHGPICHTLLTISYYAQTNIYALIGLSTINTGICWISDNVLNKPASAGPAPSE